MLNHFLQKKKEIKERKEKIDCAVVAMNITKEELTFNKDGNAIYTVQIKDFHHKMKNWPPSSQILTKEFEVQGQDLCLSIYPNGYIGENHVSVFLKNLSCEKLFVTFKLQIGDQQEREYKPCYLKPKPIGILGFSALSDHVKMFPKYRADEELNVVCTIMKLTTDKVESDLHKESEVKGDETSAKLEEMKTKLALMESKMEKLLMRNLNNNKMKKPPCPICFEEMSGSNKIAQCNNGHLLCWSCKIKMNKDDLPVDGRAFGMESYLRTLFGFD